MVEVALVDATSTPINPELSPGVGDLSERSDLSEHQQEQLRALLVRWEKVFAQHEDFGRIKLVQHRIPTGNSAPVRERYRLIPPLLYKEVKSLLSTMLEQGVIRESCSPWAAPTLSSIKMLFRCPELKRLTGLSESEWFSTFDLASGYWQVEMHPDDREKSAFTTPLGLFCG